MTKLSSRSIEHYSLPTPLVPMSDDNSTTHSRRQVMGWVGASAMLSGCVRSLPPLGRRVRLGKVEPPPVGSPIYRDWVPAPGAVEDTTFRVPDVLTAAPTRVQHVAEGGLAAFPRAVFESGLDWFGFGYDGYDRVIKVGAAYALVGDVTPETVAEALEPTGYESGGQYEEYRLFERSDVPRTVAVRPGAVLFATATGPEPSTERSGALVRALADADADRIDRHHEADPDFRHLSRAVGDRPVGWVGPASLDPTEEVVAGAISETVEGTEAYQLVHLLYPEGVEPPIRKLERAIEADERVAVSDRAELHSEGRLAIVEGVRGVKPVAEPSGPAWPQATWGVETGDESVTLRHEAGEPARADGLILLRVDSAGERTLAPTKFADRYDRVGPGDGIEVRLGEDTRQLVLEYRPRTEGAAS